MPVIHDIHQDAVLTNISIGYQNLGFVADILMPRVPVKKESDIFYKYGQEKFRIENTLRAPKSKYNRVDWTVSTDTYTCHEYGLEEAIDDREKANADDPLNLEIDSSELVTDLILLDREKRVTDLLTTGANFTNKVTLSGTQQWSDYANSDPISDIDTGIDTVLQAIAKKPNFLVISRDVFIKLKEHPAILDKIKYSQKGVITAQLLAMVFDIENVVIADSLRDTSKKGQTVSITRLWGKHCFIGYIEPRPGIKKISLGYTFQAQARITEKYRDDSIKSDVIRVTEIVDEKLVAQLCGYLIINAVA